MTINYRHRIEVTGHGPFPIDMLRYDQCYPTDPQAVADITRQDRRTVALSKMTSTRFSAFTPGRWASFGWKISDEEVEKVG